MKKNILVIDDNLTICLMLKSWLIKKDFNVETASHVEEAKDLVRDNPYDLILCDIRMPDVDGFAFLSWIKKYDSDILVILMTGYADIDQAVEAIKLGAIDYVSKPIDADKLFQKIMNAFNLQENVNKNQKFPYQIILPPGDEFKELHDKLTHNAMNNIHCLIIGNRGTGKTSSVKFIYDKGIHHSKPFITIEARNLINNRHSGNGYIGGESYLKEMFTNAKGGLLHIKGVDSLNISLQNEILSIITKQNRDENFTQLIITSEKSLKEIQEILVPKLYNLLENDCIKLPNLKGKEKQIMFFASYFIKYANHTLNKNVESIDRLIQKQLIEYDWPENIQELKNYIIKAVLMTDGKVIKTDILNDDFGKNSDLNENKVPSLTGIHSLRKENYEKEKISQALKLAKGNKTMAASILNIDRKTLYNKIKLYDVKFG